MKAEAYLQIVPTRNRNGDVKSLRITRLTQTLPGIPEPGSFVVKVKFDVDPEIFAVPTIEMAFDCEPSELASAVVPIPYVPEDEEDDDDV